MRQLTIRCRYVAHSYQGVRPDEENRSELDWPPSPARLHQALISAALMHLPEQLRDAHAGAALAALRWLERLDPPEIVASRLVADRVRPLQVAMPHNSPADASFASYHPDLAPVHRATAAADEPLHVTYHWHSEDREFSELAERHLPALIDLAAQLRYLGRAEDQVESEVTLEQSNGDVCLDPSRDTWRPTHPADVRLWTARPNSTEELIQNFNRVMPARMRRPLARRFLRLQGYACEATAGLLPVHVAIFQIFRKSRNPDELPVSCDAENAHRWRSPLRALARAIAEKPEHWDKPELARELITGHVANDEPTQQPHLAFVPLPSLSAHGQADGRVRRFALLGYASPETASAATAIYRILAACLDGEDIDDDPQRQNEKARYRLQLIEDPWRGDKMWPQFAGRSQLWLSATPIAIARGYHVPTHSPDGQRLTSSERHLRRLAEWTDLLRASMGHMRLPEDLIATCEILLTASPLLPATERAERYRAKNEAGRFIHARLEFPRPMRGPLLLGDRRYQGFGLFFPVHEL
ncbi:MAG: type I-U CRISPR-associated protein Csb2 [Verrucomicrobiota bacterium]|nr:type I-U CRISPR-associated protein Csb2 [Verrucomicrobiota bacterium]